MRSLILNLDPKNKGNEALVSSTKNIICRFREDIEFITMGTVKDTSNQIIPLPAKSALDPYAWLCLLECFVIRTLRRCGYNPHLPKRSRVRIYDNVDVVINSGGDYLSGEKFTLSGFLNIIYGLWLDKPVVLFSESLGYYKNPINRIISKYVFKNVKLILVREELSKKYLLDMGINMDKVHVTADPAFILSPASDSRIDEILKLETIQITQGPTFGVNPSGLISRYLNNPAKFEVQYIQSIAKAIDHLIETLNANILLIPHVYSTGSDDREIMRKIMDAVSNSERVFLIKNEYTSAELKGIIGLCDAFIGARMHATIAATSLCIPTVGIAYSHKMYGIIGNLLDMNQYIIDINQLDDKRLIKTIDTVWSNRDRIREHLKRIMPEVKEKALLNGYYFSNLLNEI